MVELMIWSLMVGSLGLQAAIASEWLRQRQAKIHHQKAEEEELLTPYDPPASEEEPKQRKKTNSQRQAKPAIAATPAPPTEWEFKIVHANQDLFHDPAIFRRLCEEESQAGWILLEKLDDQRVRFKRPIALREIIKPELLSFDPYRTYYGAPAPVTKKLLWIGIFLIVTLLPAYLGYALVVVTLNTPSGVSPPSPVPPSSPSPSPSPTPPTLLNPPLNSPPN